MISYVNAPAVCRLLELRESGHLSYPAFTVGVALASFVDGKTMTTSVSHAPLASRAGVPMRTLNDDRRGGKIVSRGAIRELSETGFLVVCGEPGKRKSYHLTLADTRKGMQPDPCGNPQPTLADTRRKPMRKPADVSITSVSQSAPKQNSRGASTVTWTGDSFDVPDALRQKWAEAYPDVDLDREIAKAESWYLANPSKRKKNHARFLNNWLSRAKPAAPADDPADRRMSDEEFEKIIAMENELAEEERQRGAANA